MESGETVEISFFNPLSLLSVIDALKRAPKCQALTIIP